MVITHYLGCTDHRPSRVVAKHVTTGERKVVSWDHTFSEAENHMLAAELILGPNIAYMASVKDGGYIFVRSVNHDNCNEL
jgi:hypothetical protein